MRLPLAIAQIPIALLAFFLSTSLHGQVTTQKDPASQKLNAWFTAGECAGLEGVYYENRDGGHSKISLAHYPQLKPYPLTEEEQANPKLMTGPAVRVRQGMIVIGNASMASAANQGGSLGRRFYSNPQGLHFLSGQYLSNNIYIYPEHRDHDPGINGIGGYGDIFPSNSPYVLISQGSSGSDRVFIETLLKGIAALRPEVREKLEAEKGIFPTMQKLLRETYGAEDWGDSYLTGKAHPVVFEGSLLNPLRMVEAAHALTLETLPPVVRLSILKEDKAVNGRDFFEPSGATENLGDSYCSIARVYRTSAAERKITVSVDGSTSFTPGNLTAVWVVLQGDAKRVNIEPLPDGRSAEITITSPPGLLGTAETPSRRVDIGVFVKTDRQTSAPGFITFYFPPNEQRVLGENGRTLEISYGARDGRIRLPPTSYDSYVPLLQHFRGDVDPILSPMLRGAVAPEEDRALSVLSLKLERLVEEKNLKGRRDDLAAFRMPIDQAEKDANASVAAARREAKENPGKESDANFSAAKKRREIAIEKKTKAAPEIAEQEKQITEIVEEAKAILDTPLEGIGRTANELLEVAFSQIADGPPLDTLYPDAVKKGSVGSPAGALASIRRDLVSMAILQRTPQGGYAPISRGEVTPPNDAFHLRQYNLLILGKILFPGALGSSIGSTNFVDPKISAKKLWRDVYLYGEDGSPTGWIRFQEGSYTEYNAEGKLKTATGTTSVEYGIDPKSRQLVIIP